MNTIEQTADTMFGGGKQKLQSIFSVTRELHYIMNSINSKSSASTEKAEKYNFSGQHTDIAYVDENGSISINAINSIDDEGLRSTVTENFNDAVKEGYLRFDGKEYTLTENGREHINSNAFKEQFLKDQLNSITADKAQIKLSGQKTDLNVFRYVDSINLNHLSYSNPSAFKRVSSYFEQCQKYDFVNISSDGTVTPTEKCKKFLSQNKEFNFDITKTTPDNVSDVARDISRKATEETAKQATQKVAEEAAKQAATKTAVAASSGAATGGIGAVATAVVSLSEKGLEELKKSTELQVKNTSTHK